MKSHKHSIYLIKKDSVKLSTNTRQQNKLLYFYRNFTTYIIVYVVLNVLIQLQQQKK